MNIDELVAALQALIDKAKDDGRDLTDEEMDRYEELEKQLAVSRRSAEIRSRQEAYTTPTGPRLQVATADVSDEDTEARSVATYLRTGVIDTPELRAQAELTGSAGGYLVPDSFRNKLVERLKEFGGFAALAETLNTTGGEPLEWPTVDDTAVVGEIVQEGNTFAAGADLTFGIATLGAYKYMAGGAGNKAIKVSWELLQDSAFDLTGFLSRALSTRIGRIQATHWITGTGANQPLGILPPKTAAFAIANNTTGPTYAELLGLVHAIDPAYRGPGCSWVMNDTTLQRLQGIQDANSRPLWLPAGDGNMSTALPNGTLMGYPVVIDQAMPSIATGNKFLAFGNFREAYVIRRVKDVTIVRLNELYAENGQVGFFGWARADGTVQDANAYAVIAGV